MRRDIEWWSAKSACATACSSFRTFCRRGQDRLDHAEAAAGVPEIEVTSYRAARS